MTAQTRRRCFILTAVCMVVLSLAVGTFPAFAQEATPEPTAPLTPPDLALQTLQATIIAQQTQIRELELDLKELRIDQSGEVGVLRLDQQSQLLDLEDNVRDLNSKMDLYTAIFIAGATLLGITGYRQIVTKAKEIATAEVDKQVKIALTQSLYRHDPSKHTIYLPSSLELERIRLHMSGLDRIRSYNKLDKVWQGVVVVCVSSPEENQIFIEYLDAHTGELNPYQTAFILYDTDRQYRIPPETIQMYRNLTMANTPTSLASAVLVVTRGLEPEPVENP